MPNGDYEQRVINGVAVNSGDCARCGVHVKEGDLSIVLYSTIPGERGGIFHTFPCAPVGPQWYGAE